MRRWLMLGVIGSGLCLSAIGCGVSGRVPDLGGIYDRAAARHDERRNPVIVIPGILGSRLVDEGPGGKIVWGAFAGDYADPTTPEGARLIALPMSRGLALRDMRDQVRSDGALDRLRISFFGLPIELDAYRNILATLGVGGYRDELLGESGEIDYGDDHYTCFQFDYDWRRDVVENAQRLGAFISEKRAYVQREIEERFGEADADVEFDIVSHSMGGLVTRYYLRYGANDLPADGTRPAVTWAGIEHVGRVILVGTPNAGSARSFMQLLNGVRFGPIVPRYEAAILGTMPAIYQLMPRPRHQRVVDERDRPVGDLFDVELWKRQGWGLADPEQDPVLEMLLPDVTDAPTRREIALDHLEKCLRRARMLADALDSSVRRPADLDLFLFVGDAIATDDRVRVKTGGAASVISRAPGDGTVTRASALLDERLGATWTPTLQTPIDFSHVSFLFADHLGLTRDAAFTDNMLFLLLESARRR